MSRAVSRFSSDPVARNHRQHFFDATGSKYDYNRPSDRKALFFYSTGDWNRISLSTIFHRIEKRFCLFDRGLKSYFTQLDRKNTDSDFPQLGPRKSGEQLRRVLDKAPIRSEARKTSCNNFRGQRSCERTERYFLNGLQIQLQNNWPSALFRWKRTFSSFGWPLS